MSHSFLVRIPPIHALWKTYEGYAKKWNGTISGVKCLILHVLCIRSLTCQVEQRTTTLKVGANDGICLFVGYQGSVNIDVFDLILIIWSYLIIPDKKYRDALQTTCCSNEV